jgi:hypothetical protein
MNKLTKLAAILSIIILGSCGKDSIRGEGSTISEQRNLPNYTAVQGNGDIKIHIAYGPVATTEVKGYRNLVDITETFVEDGKLVIKYKDGYYNIRNSNIELYIVMPSLTYIHTNGSGNVWIDGFQNMNSLEARVNGSSNINISNSVYENVFFDVNGSGDIRAATLLSKNAFATIHGSGDIEIACSWYMQARIYGNGDIRYWGDPQLDVQVSGTGRITKQ